MRSCLCMLTNGHLQGCTGKEASGMPDLPGSAEQNERASPRWADAECH